MLILKIKICLIFVLGAFWPESVVCIVAHVTKIFFRRFDYQFSMFFVKGILGEFCSSSTDCEKGERSGVVRIEYPGAPYLS